MALSKTGLWLFFVDEVGHQFISLKHEREYRTLHGG